MHRTDADGNVANLFNGGDPLIPRLPTQVDVPWLNAVQEELANAIEGAGITLVKGTNTQLLTALKNFAIKQASPSALTLIFSMEDTSGSPVAGKARIYAQSSATSTNITVVIVEGCSWNGSNWVPDISGGLCTRLKMAGGAFSIASFTATSTTPFADSSFNGTDNRIQFDTTGLNSPICSTFGNPSGQHKPVETLTQNDSQHGHWRPNGLASVPTAPFKGEVYSDSNGDLWVCVNATGPVWAKPSVQASGVLTGGAVPIIVRANNIASVALNGLNLRATFASPFPTADYVAVADVSNSVAIPKIVARTTTYVEIAAWDAAGAAYIDLSVGTPRVMVSCSY